MKHPIVHLSKIVMTSVAIITLGGCAPRFGFPVTGRVIDEESGKPIENAYVIAKWTGTATVLVDSRTVCLHVEADTTNDNGRYLTSPWFAFVGWPWPLWRRDLSTGVYAYKEGYIHSRYDGSIIYLKPFSGSSRERLDTLFTMTSRTRCGASEGNDKLRAPLLKAIYEEARANATQSKDEQEQVKMLRSIYEHSELGYEKAEELESERNKGNLGRIYEQGELRLTSPQN